MATLKEYFELDFPDTFRIYSDIHKRIPTLKPNTTAILNLDFPSNAMFYSFYIESNNLQLPFFRDFITNMHHEYSTGWDSSKKVQMCSAKVGIGVTVANVNPLQVTYSYMGGLQVPISQLRLTGGLYIYSESPLSKDELQELSDHALSLGYSLQFRSDEYVQTKMKFEKPWAFICHDSRDKDDVARKIATTLQKMMCTVWYDEYSINVGDNLRASIEKGIKECRKCILIVSPNFISNERWTKTEFEAIFTRQLEEKKNLILPVWYNVKPEVVSGYSLILKGIAALDWNLYGEAEVCRRLFHAIDKN